MPTSARSRQALRQAERSDRLARRARARAAAVAAAAIRSPEPVKKVELKGKEKITVPVEKPPAMEQPKEKPPEDPIQNLTIPAQTLASADLAQAGAMEGDSVLRLARPRPWRRRRNRAGHRHRSGPGIRSWRGMGRRHRRRRVQARATASKRRASPRSEAAIHRAGHAREDSGRSPARVHRPARRFGRQHPRRAVARFARSVSIRKRSKRHVSGASSPARGKGQPVPVLVTIAIAFTLR